MMTIESQYSFSTFTQKITLIAPLTFIKLHNSYLTPIAPPLYLKPSHQI